MEAVRPTPAAGAAYCDATAYSAPQMASAECAKSKTTAGLLAFLLGAFGVHKFYLGKLPAGFIMLAISVLSLGALAGIPAIVGIIEGILYLSKSEAQFCQDYMIDGRSWF